MATAPGIHPGVDLDRDGFTVLERNIVYDFARHLYVTRSGCVAVGNSDYRYVSVRPSDHIEHALPNAREFLILFSSYENFEARTLDAYSLAEQDFEERRITRYFRVLLSADKKVIPKLQKICAEEPDIPVTVPIRYDSISSGNSGDLLIAATRENYHFRDLFAQRDPLKEPTYFFGRSELLSGLRDRTSRGENCGIFGLRKSGKTSVLLAVERYAKTDGHRYIHIDCQSAGVTTVRWNDLLKSIAQKLRKLAGLAITPVQLGEFTPSAAADSFERAVNEAYSNGKKQLIIAFDEIEQISPGTGRAHWGEGDDALLFWQTIRSIHQRSKARFAFILAGTNPVILESRKLSGSDNPLLEYVHIDYLPGLTDHEVQGMCNTLGNLMGVNFEVSAVAALYEAMGGHAYLTRQVCSHVHKSKPFTNRPLAIAADDVGQALSSLDFSPLLDDIVMSLKERFPEEYTMLEWVALEDGDQVKYFLEEDAFFARHLEGYGLVVREGEALRPRMRLATEYLRRSAKQSGLVKTPSDRWGVIARRRGEIEVSLRMILRNRLIDLHGKAGALGGLTSVLTKRRGEDLQNCGFDEVFSERDCRLYWSDLISAVRTDREYWERRLGMDSSVLLTLLDKINVYRNDAHAKTMSDAEFDELMGLIDSLAEAV